MCHPTRNSAYYLPLSSRVSREREKFARFAEAVEVERGRSRSRVQVQNLERTSVTGPSAVSRGMLESHTEPTTTHHSVRLSGSPESTTEP